MTHMIMTHILNSVQTTQNEIAEYNNIRETIATKLMIQMNIYYSVQTALILSVVAFASWKLIKHSKNTEIFPYLNFTLGILWGCSYCLIAKVTAGHFGHLSFLYIIAIGLVLSFAVCRSLKISLFSLIIPIIIYALPYLFSAIMWSRVDW